MSPSRTMESPDETLSRMPPKDSKKAGYSELLFGAFWCVGTHNRQSLPPSDLQSNGGDPLVHQRELQHSGAQPGICEYPHTRLAPHTLGNSGKGGSSPSPGVWFQNRCCAWRWTQPYLVGTAPPPAPAPAPFPPGRWCSTSLEPVGDAGDPHAQDPAFAYRPVYNAPGMSEITYFNYPPLWLVSWANYYYIRSPHICTYAG